jgi:hypothetical protein
MLNKLAIAAIALWVLTAFAAGVLFLRGLTAPSQDGRTAVLVSATERDFVLTEMRRMLISVQEIVQALADGDPAKAAAAAGAAGGHAAGQAPAGLMAKLPLEFKQAGMAMHAGFDDFAKAAARGENPSALYGLLASELGACVGCHESYRIETVRQPQ